MVFVDPPEPSVEEIQLLRNTTLKKLNDDGLTNTVDARDVKRIQNDNMYIRRFLMHHDNDQKLAMEMAIDTLKWRKQVGANDITEESLDKEMVTKNSLFIHNRDIDGCKMLIFLVKNHNKDTVDLEKLKMFLIYWVDRLEREENQKFITVVFDMKDTGFKNMDMVFIQYFINLFKCYYPWILNYILVFEMPWILNAMWKIIKGWLPPKSVDKIKFIDKKAILQYVPPNQLLPEWGGQEPFTFVFTAEKRGDKSVPLIMNGDVEAKKVHFAEENSSTPSTQSMSPLPTPTESLLSQGSIFEHTKFQVEPSEKLLFSNNTIGTSSTILFTNHSPNRFAFKIKTTSPDKYHVRPSVGTIDPKGKMEVAVTLSDQVSPSILVRDKFQVIAIPSAKEHITQQEFSEIYKNVNKLEMFEIRLRVGIVSSDVAETASNHVAAPSVSPVVMTKLDQIMTRQTVIEEQMGSIRRLMYVVLFLMIALVFVFVLTTNSLTSSLLAEVKKSPFHTVEL